MPAKKIPLIDQHPMNGASNLVEEPVRFSQCWATIQHQMSVLLLASDCTNLLSRFLGFSGMHVPFSERS